MSKVNQNDTQILGVMTQYTPLLGPFANNVSTQTLTYPGTVDCKRVVTADGATGGVKVSPYTITHESGNLIVRDASDNNPEVFLVDNGQGMTVYRKDTGGVTIKASNISAQAGATAALALENKINNTNTGSCNASILIDPALNLYLGGQDLANSNTIIRSGVNGVIQTAQTTGFLVPVIPVGTATQVQGNIIYDTTNNKFKGYNGSAWVDFY